MNDFYKIALIRNNASQYIISRIRSIWPEDITSLVNYMLLNGLIVVGGPLYIAPKNFN